MDSKKEEVTVEGIQTLLDGTQKAFKMDLDSFNISTNMPLTISDLSELPKKFIGFSKASIFNVTKVNL
jgi:hypothetical protein